MPIFLVGFMASGKTTVGRALARRLGVGFVDTDEQVEQRERRSIASVFEQDGEGHFRDREWEALRSTDAEESCVVATGGGAFLGSAPRRWMKRHGLTVWLDVGLDEARRRVREVSARPLWHAREGLELPRSESDPEGNQVLLLPPGHDDVVGIGIHLRVSDAERFDDFFARALALEAIGPQRYRCGDSVISFEQAADVEPNRSLAGRGYRYLTVQVFDCDAEHRGILERGGREGRAPVTLGDVARISFVRDPDGNWIEISQRASLTGAL